MDINQIKNRLNTLQNKGKSGNNNKEERAKNYWKPTIGKQLIRIVPSKFDKTNPFKEVYFHYGVANRSMVALTNWGEKDPIVEFAGQLRKSGDKENWLLAKKIEPKMRVFVPVIVRGEEEKGVRYWEFGKEIYQELLSMAADEDIGDFSDIYEGRDITIETVGPDVTGTKFNKSTVRPRTKQTPLSEDSTKVKQWISEQNDLLSLYKKMDYEEMKTILLNWMNPEEATEEVTAETVTETTTSVVTDYATPIKKKSNFNEDEFDALFTESTPKSPFKEDEDDNDLPWEK
jgi:hypothetical protein